MKDWKETIREVMKREITHNEFMAAKVLPAQRYKYEEAFASLRNALEQFEKVVKDGIDIPCESCGRLSSPRYYCDICDNDE